MGQGSGGDTEYQANDADNIVGELFSGGLTVAEAIERLRTRLLDLSSRNRLLNYRHPKGRSVQIVDRPNLNLVFERMMDGKSAIEQARRLLAREGERYSGFTARWIPLEEGYFAKFQIEQTVDFILDTTC